MAKLGNYNGSVELMAGITQKGGGDFALVDANAIQTREDGTRLDAELETLQRNIGEKADSGHNHDNLYCTEDDVDEAIRRNQSDVGQFDGIEDEVDYVLENNNYEHNPEEMAEKVMSCILSI